MLPLLLDAQLPARPQRGLAQHGAKGLRTHLEVALHGAVVPDALPAVGERHAPVEPDDVATRGRDQLEDYAVRRGIDIDTAERYLRPNLD